MPSKLKEVRQGQKEQLEAQLKFRIEVLKKNEKTDAQIEKDPVIKKIKSQIRDSINRLTAIDKKEQVVKEARDAKLAKAAAGKQDKKKKKDVKQEASGKKKKKDKKKKKKDQ